MVVPFMTLLRVHSVLAGPGVSTALSSCCSPTLFGRPLPQTEVFACLRAPKSSVLLAGNNRKVGSLVTELPSSSTALVMNVFAL